METTDDHDLLNQPQSQGVAPGPSTATEQPSASSGLSPGVQLMHVNEPPPASEGPSDAPVSSEIDAKTPLELDIPASTSAIDSSTPSVDALMFEVLEFEAHNRGLPTHRSWYEQTIADEREDEAMLTFEGEMQAIAALPTSSDTLTIDSPEKPVVEEDEIVKGASEEASNQEWIKLREAESRRRSMIEAAEAAAEQKRQRAREEEEVRLRVEREKRAAAANARKAWFGPQTARNEPYPLVVDDTLPRRPHEAAEPVPSTSGSMGAADTVGDNQPASRDRTTMLKRPENRRTASSEERESEAAQRELDRYLALERQFRPEPPARPRTPLNLLPIEIEVCNEPMIWDDGAGEESMAPVRQERVEPMGNAASIEAQRAKPQSKKKRGDPSRRQLTVDDYVSARPSPSPPPPELGPAQLVRPRPFIPRFGAAREAQSAAVELPVRRAGMIFGGCTPIPTDPRVDPPPFACFNCWEQGHRRANCVLPARRTYCFNCGRRDVEMQDCPRCREGSRRYWESRTTTTREQVNVRDNEPSRSWRDRTPRGPSRETLLDRRRVSTSSRTTDRAYSNREDRFREPAAPGEFQRSSVRQRLGPVVNTGPSVQANARSRSVSRNRSEARGSIREALEILEAIRDLPRDTRDGLLFHLYRRHDEERRQE